MWVVSPCSLVASLHCLIRNLILKKSAVHGVCMFHEIFSTRAVQLYLAKGHKGYSGLVLGPHF
jgi:hypothetical protein